MTQLRKKRKIAVIIALRMVIAMKLIFNEDKEMVRRIREGLQRKEGYCPCRIERTEDNQCMCKEFREQVSAPDFEGYCHCRLYYKFKD